MPLSKTFTNSVISIPNAFTTMKTTFNLRLLRALFLITASLWLSSARAEISAVINSITETNTSKYLINSDASNPAAGIPGSGYDRDAIHATAAVQFTRVNLTDTFEYRFHFQLLNEAGTAVPLNVGGLLLNEVNVVRNVTGTGLVNQAADLVPAGILQAGANYRLKVSLWRRATGSVAYVNTNLSSTGAEQKWVHFSNTTSNDISLNAVPQVDTVTWSRPWTVQANPDLNAFDVRVGWTAARYDGFLTLPPEEKEKETFQMTVVLTRVSDNQTIPLQQSVFTEDRGMFAHVLTAKAKAPYPLANEVSHLLIKPTAQLKATVQPAGTVETYTVKVSIIALNSTLAPISRAIPITAPARPLMHFNGTLRFGSNVGQFTSVAYPSPLPGAIVANRLACTGLRIDGQSGTITGLPGATFGDGSPLAVDLEDDGDAFLSSGSINGIAPSNSYATAGNLRFERRSLVLSPLGARANIALVLPTGLCATTGNPDITRIWDGEVVISNVALTPAFLPASADLPLGAMWISEESKPLRYHVIQGLWNVAASRLTFVHTGESRFVRQAEMDALNADVQVLPAIDRRKRSNDHVFLNMSQITSPNIIVDTSASGLAKLSVQCSSAGGQSPMHFPETSTLGWGGGVLKIDQDVIDISVSRLTNVVTVNVPYARDCGGEDCPGVPPPPAQLGFHAAGQTLQFTADGGVAGPGTLLVSSRLKWGMIKPNVFAHQTSEFTASHLHIPGCSLMGKGNLAPEKRPGYMLYSGVDETTGVMERPGSANFETGLLGVYPGLNFRRPSGPTFPGWSVLAGVPVGPYELSHRCHYVTRRGGVSGIHEAYTGTFPPDAILAGYPVQFEDFGIQLVMSKVTDTRTKGSMSVPFPTNLKFAFDKLFFTCLGAPSDIILSPSEIGVDKVLQYWQADIQIQNAQFVPLAASCDPGDIRLALSITGHCSELPAPLYGTIAVLPNGQLARAADPATDPAITSRLTLPANILIDGPGAGAASETWHATTVGEAYFNHEADAHGPAITGWLNIAAKIDLPFFEDAPVHLHTRASKYNLGSTLFLMGGFQDPAKCFSQGKNTYFNQPNFDPENRGYPTGVSVDAYRSGNEDNDKYRMHAQTEWLDVVQLDYVMAWQVGPRAFKDFKETGSNLLILAVKHRCRTLTPENADLEFGLKAGTSKLSLSELAGDAMSELLGVVGDFIDMEVLTAGREAIEDLLEPTMRALFDVPVGAMSDLAAKQLVDLILAQDSYNPATKKFNQAMGAGDILGLLGDKGTNLPAAMGKILGTVNDVTGLLRNIKTRLELAKTHISGFREYTKTGGKIANIENVALGIAAAASAALKDQSYVDEIKALIQKAKPIIAQLDELAAKAEIVCEKMLAGFGPVGEVAKQFQKVMTDIQMELDGTIGGVAGDVVTVLKSIKPGVDNALDTGIRSTLEKKISQAIQDRFYATGLTARVQEVLKQRLYDVEQQMREVVDGVLEQADIAAREVIATVLGGVDKKLQGFLGDAGGVMAGAEAKGKAHIRGDSLTDLRLDVKVEFKAGKKALKAHVFVEIKELNSENTPGGCLPDGKQATEVTLGAKDIGVDWLYPDLRVNFATRFQFSDGKLTGMGGSINIAGAISFGDQFIINEMGCAIMFGKTENYFSAALSMTVKESVQAKGGIFFGKACSLDPFFWDDTVGLALGDPPFTGAYGYGEFHTSLNQYIGIPATCFFNISVGAGAGVGFLAEGPTLIGKMYFAVQGDLICVISITGEVSLVAVVNVNDPANLSLVGKGRFIAELGWCPICITIDKSVLLKYKSKKWDLDVQ
jgi:hypothetical protein